VTFLSASGDNRADSNLKEFLNAVGEYGIPSRVRSDKGGENVLIAQFMIQRRGLNRASHICGRSVHNQRYLHNFRRQTFFVMDYVIQTRTISLGFHCFQNRAFLGRCVLRNTWQLLQYVFLVGKRGNA